MTLLLTVIAVALVFEFVNGFHDTANSVAAVVGTKVLTPTYAIALASVGSSAAVSSPSRAASSANNLA